MKKLTIFVVIAIWIYLAIYLPKLSLNSLDIIYLVFITYLNIFKLPDFLIWNFNDSEID
jgi:hypothetical protein